MPGFKKIQGVSIPILQEKKTNPATVKTPSSPPRFCLWLWSL